MYSTHQDRPCRFFVPIIQQTMSRRPPKGRRLATNGTLSIEPPPQDGCMLLSSTLVHYDRHTYPFTFCNAHPFLSQRLPDVFNILSPIFSADASGLLTLPSRCFWVSRWFRRGVVYVCFSVEEPWNKVNETICRRANV